MSNSQPRIEKQTCGAEATLAKSLAPEEICPGDYVTLLHEVYELPSYLWFDDAAMSSRDELVRIQLVPECGGVPLKVKSVCLPFVLVKHPTGQQQTLDVRRAKLARLDTKFARVAWKSHSNKRAKKKKKNR